MMETLKAGVYRHYKGPLYLVLGLAHDANAGDLYSTRSWVARSSERYPLGEREVVVYVGLQTDEAHPGARLAVRTVDDFFAWVHDESSPRPYGSECRKFALTQEGNWCHCGEYPARTIVQRFVYVGARYTP